MSSHGKFVSQPFFHGELETLQGTTDNKLFDLDSLYTQLFVLPYFQSWLEPLCYNLLSPHLYIDWHRHIALLSSLRYLFMITVPVIFLSALFLILAYSYPSHRDCSVSPHDSQVARYQKNGSYPFFFDFGCSDNLHQAQESSSMQEYRCRQSTVSFLLRLAVAELSHIRAIYNFGQRPSRHLLYETTTRSASALSKPYLVSFAIFLPK